MKFVGEPAHTTLYIPYWLFYYLLNGKRQRGIYKCCVQFPWTMRFINLCTVDNSYEANFIKEDLALGGIACIVTNENFTSLMPHMNGILGSGIQILVDKDNLETARQIIEKRTGKTSRHVPSAIQ
jgi:hypothetical protein